MRTLVLVGCALAVVFLLSLSSSIPATSIHMGVAAQTSERQTSVLHPMILKGMQSKDTGTFAFVSNFEDLALDGWSRVKGSTPTIVTSLNYSGEPSLKSVASSKPQIDYANSGFVTGQPSVSFQVAINAPSGTSGYFGLGSSDKKLIAVVGVSKGDVYAGKDLSSLKEIEPVPTGTAYPPGWVYIIANLALGSNGKWTMQVFVDRTDEVAMTVSVPKAGHYAGALIETVKGTVYYTNIIVSTYAMAIIIQGYNNMEGYGQGSALLVTQLPAYTNYTAVMTLTSWSIPQSGILSFQINAMNETGTTQSTCVGFFQLGMDLDQNGKIDPWYVPGVDCEATSFNGDVSTPAGSQIVLSIIWMSSSHKIEFREDDLTISKVFSTTISYSGGAFYGAYTQMEFQPCCNDYPISDYGLVGSLFDMQITPVSGTPEPLNATYMLPFNLDAPPSWDLTYYQNSAAGYVENNTG